jgi:hypothetical protein
MWLNPISRTGVSLSALIALTGCLQVNQLKHQPAAAGRKAQQFANVAFVERNLDAAYPLLSQNVRNSLTLDQFKDAVSKMHPSEYPLFVRATEYEPLMGQRAMNIYLIGDAEKERLYYRFVMEGTQETDYTVGGFWRNNGPYPASDMRKAL